MVKFQPTSGTSWMGMYYLNMLAILCLLTCSSNFKEIALTNGKDLANFLRYFRKVDGGLQEMLKNQQAPLVFAGVEYLLPILKEANKHSYLMDEAVTVNPGELKPEKLHAQAC